MTIAQILKKYSASLNRSSSPILDVGLLLTKTLNKPKEYLYKYPEKTLSTKQLTAFKKIFKRRLAGEPIAYILGHKEFYNLDFKVNKNVLIPRPETEMLVEEVIRYSKSHISALSSPISDLKSQISIIEIGVGSGAIIITLAKNIKPATFYASDISAQALTIAKQNAKTHKVKIKFLNGNLLNPLKSKIQNPESYIIVANLPYLTKLEMKNPTLKFDPKLALAAGPDGLKYFREFFQQIKTYQIKPLAIFLEIGHNQGEKIKKLVQLSLPKYKITVQKDLCGFDRIVKIIK